MRKKGLRGDEPELAALNIKYRARRKEKRKTATLLTGGTLRISAESSKPLSRMKKAHYEKGRRKPLVTAHTRETGIAVRGI